jgi:hypothetical protein
VERGGAYATLMSSRPHALAFALSALALTGFVACGSTARPSGFDEGPDGGDPSADGSLNGGDSGAFDLDSGAFGDGAAVGQLKGTVMAPNGTVPVAGALVYLTAQRPEPTPARVHCDTCVQVGPTTPHAIANEKGEFSLGPKVTGAQFLVVQKGGFRRVREIYVQKGEETLPTTLTTLPGKTDAARGDEVPKMTVVHGQYDEIEASLEKLGIDKSAMEIVTSPLVGDAAKAFLRDKARVDDKHIIFLPCGDYTQPTPNVDLSADETIRSNLKAFVEAGGRLYVTDWHYDFLTKTFPGFVSFEGESNVPCSGCGRLSYDATATTLDPSLGAWMGAQGLSTFTLEKNYTGISKVSSVTQGTKTITPRVWVSGSRAGQAPKPATVSFEQGCGRVLFSTYHTEPFASTLTPQERALLGVLLEVAVCNDSPTGVVIK